MILIYLILLVFLIVGGLVWIHSINNSETHSDLKKLEMQFAEMEKSYEEWMSSHFLSMQSEMKMLNVTKFRQEALRHLYGKMTGLLLSLHIIRLYSDEVKMKDKTLFFENAKMFLCLLLKRLYHRKNANHANIEITKGERKEFYSFMMATITDDIRKRASIWGIKVQNPNGKLYEFPAEHEGWEEWNDWGEFPFYEDDDENNFHNGQKRSDVFPPEDNFVPPNPKYRLNDDDDLPF